MEEIREIKKIIAGKNTMDGAGVKLVRVIGHDDTADSDPFLMMDAFDSTNPSDYTKGFPWHPHRGIETITYLVQGDIEHGDSIGNKGTILSGDCQWMTAGSGIIHQEMPKVSPRLLGIQLWLNLPAEHKMTQPKYRDIRRSAITAVEDGPAKVHILSGTYKETKGALEGDYVKPIILDVEVKAEGTWSFDIDPEYNLFIYIFHGAGFFHPEQASPISGKQAVFFKTGKQFWVKAADQGIRFLLLAGKPLKEPIAWGGPIVMNTQQELDLAFEEINNNTFIKTREIDRERL